MKAEQITASVFARAGSGETQIIHGLEKDQWLNTITAGQILKGRVLREYSDGRYGVSFNGQERIVDSTISLTNGQWLTGKVLNVNERNVSIKLINHKAGTEKTNQALSAASTPETALDLNAHALKINLTQVQKNAINQASAQVNSTLAITVGLYLAKLGLPLQADLIRLLAARVMNHAEFSIQDLNQQVPMVSLRDADHSQSNLEVVEILRRAFQQQAPDLDKQGGDMLGNQDAAVANSEEELVAQVNMLNQEANEDAPDERHQLQQMLIRLLNAGEDSVVQHQLTTLPIIVDGQLHEFDVAIFDQADNPHNQDALKSKRLKFALETQSGLVNLDVHVVNNRMRLSVAAENEAFIELAEGYANELTEQLADAGWVTDDLSYQVAKHHIVDTAAHEVVKHVLQQGSLDIEV